MTQILFGFAVAFAMVAAWNLVVHSRPTHARLELRRMALVKARALHAAEMAGLQAYEEVYADVEADRWMELNASLRESREELQR